ncbi:unnamed protein product [Protopolystoma xenopodis]|uniref:Uncharacterized protein n=1 Tax=Protopolystoma xenopodis TaxID=117903 RepID=A0A3S5FBP6_9PLAT|nr:unnamed protein product [Protopolystoma xenopodis]
MKGVNFIIGPLSALNGFARPTQASSVTLGCLGLLKSARVFHNFAMPRHMRAGSTQARAHEVVHTGRCLHPSIVHIRLSFPGQFRWHVGLKWRAFGRPWTTQSGHMQQHFIVCVLASPASGPRPTDQPTDRPTDQRTDGPTDRLTDRLTSEWAHTSFRLLSFSHCQHRRYRQQKGLQADEQPPTPFWYRTRLRLDYPHWQPSDGLRSDFQV